MPLLIGSPRTPFSSKLFRCILQSVSRLAPRTTNARRAQKSNVSPVGGGGDGRPIRRLPTGKRRAFSDRGVTFLSAGSGWGERNDVFVGGGAGAAALPGDGCGREGDRRRRTGHDYVQ